MQQVPPYIPDDAYAGDTATDRATFIRRVYAHLAMAIAAFLALEVIFFQTGLPEAFFTFISGLPFAWLGVLGAFIIVGWIARSFASNAESISAQYFGLGLYIVAEAIIFMPLLFLAELYSNTQDIYLQAGGMTVALFAGLTATVFITRKDFSFLRGILMVGFFVALGLIICGTVFGFNLGLAFSAGMILLAAGAILYDTSNILHHYPEDRYVGASLELFASVALLFWYALQLVMALSGED